MESKRQAKFARQIQKDIGEIFLREGQSLTGIKFINVTTVRVSPDLGYAKIYISFLNESDPQRALSMVKIHNKELRRLLGEKIKNTVRKIPEIEFFYDDTMDFVEKIDKLFDKIHESEDPGKKEGQA